MPADTNLVAQQLSVRKCLDDAFLYHTDGIVVRHRPEDVEDSERATDAVAQSHTWTEGAGEVGDIAMAEKSHGREDRGAPEQVEDDKIEDMVLADRPFGTGQQVVNSDKIEDLAAADQHFWSDLVVVDCDDLLLDEESENEVVRCFPGMLNGTFFSELGDIITGGDSYNALSESGSECSISPSLQVDMAHPQETDAGPELKPPLVPSAVSRTETVVHARLPSMIDSLHHVSSDGTNQSFAACGSSFQVAFGSFVLILLLSVCKMNWI